MPLIKHITDGSISIGIWQLTEPSGELRTLLSPGEADVVNVESFKSEQRKREFLAVRLLLESLLGYYPVIAYDQNRKPFLRNNRMKLSISHSGSLAAVILAPVAAGIDTEETIRNVSIVAPRFLSAEELAWISKGADPNTVMVLCWSIKETVFKMAESRNTDFRSDIQIFPVIPEPEGSTRVTYREGSRLEETEVHYFFQDKNVVTWCLRGGLI